MKTETEITSPELTPDEMDAVNGGFDFAFYAYAPSAIGDFDTFAVIGSPRGPGPRGF